MRAIGVGDLDEALRAVLALPEAARLQGALDLLARAHAADKHRKRLGRVHPRWGDGSLMAAARVGPQADYPHRYDDRTVAGLALVLHAIVLWRAGRRPSFLRGDIALSEVG